MKKKGFTLIELLAVIIILAIIALITVPVIMNIIERANKSAFKDSAYGIIKAGELHYADKLLDSNGMVSDITFTFPDATGLDIKGSRPKGGNMKVTIDGEIILAISNGKWCARKSLNDEDVTIDDNIDDCSLTKTPNPIITTNNTCLTDGICENGTKLNVKVNEKENYDFYVIKDDGNELTLIMNKNLGETVAWISQTDYEESGGTNYGEYGNNEKGPLTVLEELKIRTKDWTNIKAYDYTLNDDSGKNKYQSIKIENVRARMLTYTEAIKLNCIYEENNSCPEYLYENSGDLKDTNSSLRGYWLSSAHFDSSQYGLGINLFGRVSYNNVNRDFAYGIRAVIKIPKTI